MITIKKIVLSMIYAIGLVILFPIVFVQCVFKGGAIRLVQRYSTNVEMVMGELWSKKKV